MDGDSLTRLGDEELLATLGEVEARRCALYAQGLALLAEIDSRGLAPDKGHRDTPGLIAEVLRVNRGDAARRAAHARALLPSRSLSGAMIDPLLPHTGQAVADGEINQEQVRVIHDTSPRSRRTPPTPTGTPPKRSCCKPRATAHPARWHGWGRRSWPGWTRTAPHPTTATRPAPRRELRLHTARGGRVKLTGELDAEAGALLTSLLSPLAAPQPAQDGQVDPRSHA